jgi:hypothetical protein
MKSDQDRKRRRRRCGKHPDMLTEDGCPRCQVERLEKLNRELAESAGIHGPKAKVRVTYRWRDVFTKLLKLLAVPKGEWNDPAVSIGKGSGCGNPEVWLPKELAEELAEIGTEMDEAYIKALLHGYSDGVQVVSRATSSVFDRMMGHEIKLKAKDLKKLFAKDKYYRGEFNIAVDALKQELLSIFDKE